MELSRVIKERFSVRTYTDQIPSSEQITAIVDAGRLAPSWVNVQPWHFIVVQDKETIELLGKMSYDQPHVHNANTLIVICGMMKAWEKENYRKIIESRPNIAKEKVDFLLGTPAFNPKMIGEEAVIYRTVEEVTYATAFMTLECHNQGLGCCIIGGMHNPLTKSGNDIYEKAAKKLNLPPQSMIIAMLVVGYPQEEPPQKTRKSMDEVVSYNAYGIKYLQTC